MSKETIQEFLNEVNEKIWADSKRMQDYEKKQCSDVFKSTGGHYVEFEKPYIKKDFCFGHGQNGISTQEEVEIACDNAHYARTNEGYFLQENLSQYDEMLETLNGDEKLYLIQNYRKPSKIACIRTEEYFRHYEWDRQLIVEELSDYDIEELKKMVKKEKEKFAKRLNTYLKRYGLSKVHSWTYLVD